MAKLRNRLDTLMKEWERKNRGVALSALALSKATGVHRDVINRYRHNDVTRYDQTAVTELCRFFGVEVGDFLYIEWEQSQPADDSPPTD